MKQVRQELPPLSSPSSLGNKEFFKLETRSSLLLQPKDRAGKQTPGLTFALPRPFPSLHALETAGKGVYFVLHSSKASPGEEQSPHLNGPGPGSSEKSCLPPMSTGCAFYKDLLGPSPHLHCPTLRRDAKRPGRQRGQLPHQVLAPRDARHHVSLHMLFLQREAVRTWFTFSCI